MSAHFQAIGRPKSLWKNSLRPQSAPNKLVFPQTRPHRKYKSVPFRTCSFLSLFYPCLKQKLVVCTMSLLFPFPIACHAQSFPHHTRANLDGAWFPNITQWDQEEVTGDVCAYQDVLQVPAVSAKTEIRFKRYCPCKQCA